jgi:hypothetical protein
VGHSRNKFEVGFGVNPEHHILEKVVEEEDETCELSDTKSHSIVRSFV